MAYFPKSDPKGMEWLKSSDIEINRHERKYQIKVCRNIPADDYDLFVYSHSFGSGSTTAQHNVGNFEQMVEALKEFFKE